MTLGPHPWCLATADNIAGLMNAVHPRGRGSSCRVDSVVVTIGTWVCIAHGSLIRAAI